MKTLLCLIIFPRNGGWTNDNAQPDPSKPRVLPRESPYQTIPGQPQQNRVATMENAKIGWQSCHQ